MARTRRRPVRLLLAAALLGLATVAAPIAATTPAAHAEVAPYTRQCVDGADTGGRSNHIALCVYDDHDGHRFARIAYRNTLYGTTVHELQVSLMRCQGPDNCVDIVAPQVGQDDYLPINERMVETTVKVVAQYGYSYKACGNLHSEEFYAPRYHWFWSGCTPFIPGAPKISISRG